MLSFWRQPEVLYEAFALTGCIADCEYTQVLPWATSFWAFSPFLNHLQKTERIFILEVHYRLNSILCHEQRFQLVVFLY